MDAARFLALRQRGEELAERLPALLVEAERVAATVAQGVHGRRRTGVGETFWQFRLYQPGDDARSIDWRQSARSSHLHFIREQEWEAAESVWLWCDFSPSMAFRAPPARESKGERAFLLAVALAVLLVRAGERVAVLGSGLPPRGGRYGLESFCRDLLEAARRRAPEPPLERLPKFARLLFLSDFLAPPASWENRFARFTALGLRAGALQIVDPAEEELPFEGRVLFEGMEGEGSALIGNVEAVRAAYRERFRAHREALARSCLRRSWAFAVHRTDRPPSSGLLTLYQMLAPNAVD